MRHRLPASSLILLGLLTACGDGADEPTACSLSLTSEAIAAAQCGQANGSVALTTSGDAGAVSYRLDNGAPQGSPTFEALAPGSYTITAENGAGCTATTSVTVIDEEATLAVTAVVESSDCNQSDGGIALEVLGGTSPYTYRLDSSDFSDDSVLSGLSPGEYTVTIRDAKGCTTRVDARVASGISFDTTIKEIIATNCAVTGCHAAGGRNPNFEVKDNIFANAARIGERTTEKSMPPPSSGRSLTDEQITQIACWVGDGAPDN